MFHFGGKGPVNLRMSSDSCSKFIKFALRAISSDLVQYPLDSYGPNHSELTSNNICGEEIKKKPQGKAKMCSDN
jgi:hypothetical protein